MADYPPQVLEYLRRARADRKRLGREFAGAMRVGDVAHLRRLVAENSGDRTVLGAFLSAAARTSGAPEAVRSWFSVGWVEDNHIWRDAATSGQLAKALRNLMPEYHGPARRLYRGETSWNRRRRSYGLSWTIHEEVAREFAECMATRYPDGTVLLATTAPAEAIISAPAEYNDSYEEGEYLVHRGALTSVQVLQRFRGAVPDLASQLRD